MYDRRVRDRRLTFGVSGRLYENNVLLYDRETESLWSQLAEEAVTGPLTGTPLRVLPSVVTTWGSWRKRHPQTLVLSPDTGHSRPYGRDPYAGYEEADDLQFPVSRIDRRLRPKERVLGLELGGESRALPLERLASAKTPLRLPIGGREVTIEYDPGTRTAEAFSEGKPLAVFTGYWFAWYAFHPDTEVWGDERRSGATPTPVTILDHRGSWADLTGVADLDADVGSFYMVSGKLRNDGRASLRYVKLAYELVDARGEVVYRDYGYNRGAESLRDDPPGVAGITPVPAGATESFRMFFFREELPPFEGYRVRVIEAASH